MASGCAVCAATNQCNFAFRNGPGQYCGDWYDYNTLTRKPCCCPLLQVGSPSTCKMTPTQCNCHIYHTNSSPNYNPRPAQTHSKYSYLPNTHQHTVWHPTRRPSPVAPLIMILLVVGCCFMCCCRKRHWHNHQHDGVPIATAVGVDASCPPENPAFVGYGSTSSSHHHNHHSGGGNAVASGLGGFAIGTIIGDLIGRNAGSGGGNHYQNNMPMFGGGNDGGYDIVGDSGDNNFGGYDIQGDSGGYDIQGDS